MFKATWLRTRDRWIVLVALSTLLMPAMLGCSRNSTPDVNGSRGTAMAIRRQLSGDQVASVGGARPDPTGFANVKGVFRLNGPAPALNALAVSGDDAAYCGKNGLPQDTSVAVGSNGGLANVLIYVTSKIPEDNPAWEHPDHTASKFAELEGEQGFDQENCVFKSRIYAMRGTQKAEILNSDPIAHNTNIAPQKGASRFNELIPAKSSKKYYVPGGVSPTPFDVSCSIHPWMKSYMITCGNALFAVTDANGNFEIKNVPAGVEIEFRVWHERSKFIENVTLDGSPQNWSRGKFNLKLEPGVDKSMEVVLEAAIVQ